MTSWPETPGKRYLLPPEKPDDLVREHRADDQRDVVLDDGPVDPHVDGLRSRPSDSSAIRSPPIVPTWTKVSGSHHSWLSTEVSG